MKTSSVNIHIKVGGTEVGGLYLSPPILADHLPLCQPAGRLCPPHLLLAPPPGDFKTFRCSLKCTDLRNHLPNLIWFQTRLGNRLANNLTTELFITLIIYESV